MKFAPSVRSRARTRLIATSSPVARRSARKTTPYSPFPISAPFSYFASPRASVRARFATGSASSASMWMHSAAAAPNAH